MATVNLKNKPLQEALLEVRWRLNSGPDPFAKLLPGVLFSKLNAKYPVHEQLPQASLPDEVTQFTPQHRFRRKGNEWPLFQIGPGVLTLNHTAGYEWDTFKADAAELIQALFDLHPGRELLKVDMLNLRYIDSVQIDTPDGDVFRFLHEKMRVTTTLPSNLFEGDNVSSRPETFSWHSSFVAKKPAAKVSLAFGLQKEGDRPMLIWDTQVTSRFPEVPQMPGEFDAWINSAHDITHDWFFKLIEGELRQRFDS